MGKYLNVAIQDDTGKEIVNAIRSLSGLEPLVINYKDVDRSLLDTTGKLIVEAISSLSGGGGGGGSPDLANIEARLSALEHVGAYVFRGSVATVNDLPDGANLGDVYDVQESGMNYAWNGDAWDALGSVPATLEEMREDIDKMFE